MTIAERLQAAAPRTDRCKAGTIIAGLPADDREAIEAALSTHSAAVLCRILKLEGYPVGVTTLKLHKAGACTCVDHG